MIIEKRLEVTFDVFSIIAPAQNACTFGVRKELGDHYSGKYKCSENYRKCLLAGHAQQLKRIV